MSRRFQQRIVIKLKASRNILYQRIENKKKNERGGNWLFSATFPDKRAFVRKLYNRFKQLPADYCIDTDRLKAKEVYKLVLERLSARQPKDPS
jgi:hypothetical protein